MEKQAYISRVHLKGYKSIRDLEIDFKPGLNIIIGPNGSGKTNFLEFIVESQSSQSYPELAKQDFYSAIQTTSSKIILKGFFKSSQDDVVFQIREKGEVHATAIEWPAAPAIDRFSK